MNSDPNDPNYPERHPNYVNPDPSYPEQRRDLLEHEESLRLQQEEVRLEAARRNMVFTYIINGISYLVGLLEVLLLLRFMLRVFGANTQNTFARFIYTLSEPFVAPFSTLFVSPVAGGGSNIFDVNLLIAIVVYALLGWLVISLIRFIWGR